MFHDFYWMPFWMPFAGFLGFLFLVLIVVLIVRLVAGRRGDWHRGPEHKMPWEKVNTKALEILAERYAKGELSDEEYQKKKEELSKS